MNIYFTGDRVDVHVQNGPQSWVFSGIFHEETERGVILLREQGDGNVTDSYTFVPWHAILAVVAQFPDSAEGEAKL